MIYIQRSDGAIASFDGMTLVDITAMLSAQGLTLTVIDEATYRAAQPKF